MCFTSLFDLVDHLKLLQIATDVSIKNHSSDSLQQKQPSERFDEIHTKQFKDTDFNGFKVLC